MLAGNICYLQTLNQCNQKQKFCHTVNENLAARLASTTGADTITYYVPHPVS